jgi:hypothetical protein
MEKPRLALSLVMLVLVIALGSFWPTETAKAVQECNCVDGYSKQAGVMVWDSEQKRTRCIPGGCDVITVAEAY